MPSLSFRDYEQHLEDILENVQLVEQFSAGKTFQEYETDILFRSAVERRLQIITEAAHRLGADVTRVDPEIDWKGIRGLGNVLRHAYHGISNEAIWRVVTEELPVLKKSVEAALKG